DYVHTPRGMNPAEGTLLRVAFDAIANVIERDSLSRDRARLEKHLNQARRLESIGAFATGIAHNFNNIIGAILGFAESAQSRAGRGSRVADSLGEIRSAGERARRLVEQILAFGRPRSVHRGPVCLQHLAAEAKTLLEAGLPRSTRLALRQSPEAVIVNG